MSNIPSDAPPSYDVATSSSARPQAGAPSSAHNASSHLEVPGSSSRVTNAHRRSLDDEVRRLPKGWVRQYDRDSHHHFYVDTTKEPPHSIWHHPYDDDEYLATLSGEEREQLEQEAMQQSKNPSRDDYIAAHSEDDEDYHHSTSGAPAELPPRPDGKGKGQDKRSFGRKLKDKATGTTHEERVQERKKRDEAEQKRYERQLQLRQAMIEAEQTGKPVLIGKDKDGKDVYIEPPQMMGSSAYPGSSRYPAGGYGYSPYGNSGMYAAPNARYMRPAGPYGRPMGGGYGYGYGGGLGGGSMMMPLALGMGGGLLLGGIGGGLF